MTDDDKKHFREAMRGVKKLNGKDKHVYRPPPKKPIKHNPHTPEEWTEHGIKKTPLRSESKIFYVKPGLLPKTLRNLKRGDYNSDARLDLHGCTLTEARDLLSNFLSACRKHRYTYVTVIHGKGFSSQSEYPVLKNAVTHWLKKTPDVLALVSAPERQGGTGALTVLLKRRMSHE